MYTRVFVTTAAHIQQLNWNMKLKAENKDLTAKNEDLTGQLAGMHEAPLSQTGVIADAKSPTHSAPAARTQLMARPSTGIELYWTEEDGRRSRTGEGKIHAKALVPDSIRSEDGLVITKPDYNKLRASARRELDAVGDRRPWRQLDRLVKQRLLRALEAQYPILKLCASSYKARRVYEEILVGWNRTSRMKRKAEAEPEEVAEEVAEEKAAEAAAAAAEEEEKAEAAMEAAKAGMAKKRAITAARSAAKGKGRAARRYRPYTASSKHLIFLTEAQAAF